MTMISKFKKVFSLVLIICFLFSPVEVFAVDFSDMLSLIDWSCVELTVLGICWHGIVPGILLRYYEPVLLIETVKQPGDSAIEIMKDTLSQMTQSTANSLLSATTGISAPVTSGSGSSAQTQENLKFNEVHVYDFPFQDIVSHMLGAEDCILPQSPMFIKYLSELDSIEWRIGGLEALHPKSIASAAVGAICGVFGTKGDLCMGVWGPIYPRRGFFVHQSEVVGSAVAAVRSVLITSSPLPGHVVLSGLNFLPSLDQDKIQLIWPENSGCLKAGKNPVLWERGKTSQVGKYLWVYWRPKICCVW